MSYAHIPCYDAALKDRRTDPDFFVVDVSDIFRRVRDRFSIMRRGDFNGHVDYWPSSGRSRRIRPA